MMHLRFKPTLALLLLSMLSLLPSLLATAAPPTKPPRPRPAIALMVPMTGPWAKLGRQLAQTAQVAATEAQVQLVLIDTHNKSPRALATLETILKQPTLSAIIGPVGVRESERMIPLAHKHQVPLLMLGALGGMERRSPWVWRLRPTPEEYAEAIAKEALSRKHKRAAIMYPDNSFGIKSAIRFGEVFTQGGGKITAVSSYPVDAKDWRHPMEVLRGRRAQSSKTRYTRTRPMQRRGVDFDVLFIPDFHKRVAKFLPLMEKSGITPGPGNDNQTVQLLGVPGWQGVSMRYTEAHAAGAIYHDPFAGSSAEGEAEEFERLIEEKTGRLPVDLDAEVFDAVIFTARRARQAFFVGARGKVLRQRVAKTLPKPKSPWYGMCGEWGFDAFGAPQRPFVLYRFDSDGVVVPEN